MRRFKRGALGLLVLGVALNACADPQLPLETPEETQSPSTTPPEPKEPGEKQNPCTTFVVHFDKNNDELGSTEANPQSKTLSSPATTLDQLPENPTRPGYSFEGWNMAADGSGMPFSTHTPVEANLTVFAQWSLLPSDALLLSVDIIPSTAVLTPMEAETYSERSTVFFVRVLGFESEAEANMLGFGISHVPGLSLGIIDHFSEGARVFEIRVDYDGARAFAEGSAAISFRLLGIPQGYAYAHGSQSTRIAIRDGQEKTRPIPVGQHNIEAFNAYANTPAGLAKHYQLSQNVVLPPPPEGQSNWRPIGSFFNPFTTSGEDAPFTGSFDGEGHTLSGLTVHASDNGFHGMFGALGSDAVVENLGLTGGSMNGDGWVGALAGENRGTVQNCSTTGNVSSPHERSFARIGGVVGQNSGTVENCYSTGLVRDGGHPIYGMDSDGFIGGVVGWNSGTLRGCYSTGEVVGGSSLYAGNGYTGGVVGSNQGGTIEECHATGGVTGTHGNGNGSSSHTGGVVGLNAGGMVRNGYATGIVTGGSAYYGSTSFTGGVVGWNTGTVQDCYATEDVDGNNVDFRRATGVAGGVVGVNAGGTVQNCYSTGAAIRSKYAGGVAGESSGTLQNCHATGNIFSQGGYGGNGGGVVGQNSGTVENCYSTGDVFPMGPSAGGGVAGLNFSGGTIRNSYSTGNTVAGGSVGYNGGVVGQNNGMVENCYATGNVTGTLGGGTVGGVAGSNAGILQNCYATSNVTGGTAGGVAGSNAGTVQACYATGIVIGNDTYYNNHVGGVVGWNEGSGTVQNSLALNPSLSGIVEVGRVVGNNAGVLSENAAFIGMQNTEGNTTWPHIGANDIDGEDRSAEELQSEHNFPPALRSAPWVYFPGHLPGLLGQTVEMPSHLRP